jgi:uncharacterized protein YqeY
MLAEMVKSRMVAAMKSKNNRERDVLRFVLSELQRSNIVDPTDDQVVKVIKKTIENNGVTLKFCHADDPRLESLEEENAILNGILPKEWDSQTIEAFFLNGDDPVFEQIRNADKEGKAIGIAMKALKAANAPVDSKLVNEVVKKIRTFE